MGFLWLLSCGMVVEVHFSWGSYCFTFFFSGGGGFLARLMVLPQLRWRRCGHGLVLRNGLRVSGFGDTDRDMIHTGLLSASGFLSYSTVGSLGHGRS